MNRQRRRLLRAVCGLCVLMLPSPARAQAPLPGRFEFAIGPVWVGRAAFDARDANETTGTGDTFRLFAAETELAAASGFEAHLGARVFRAVEAEASASYAKPQLRTAITTDAETSNAPLTITTDVQQFMIGGAALWYPRLPRTGGRVRVFLRGGAGYLRQLEDDATLIVTGRTFDAGGGVKLVLGSRAAGFWNAIGARIDARAVVRTDGVTTDDRMHVSPAVGASLFLRF